MSCLVLYSVPLHPLNLCRFLQAIFFGGIDVSIRGEVWPFLLHYYSHESTSEEREALREQKRKEYAAIQQKRCIGPQESHQTHQTAVTRKSEVQFITDCALHEPWFRWSVSLPRASTNGWTRAVATLRSLCLGPGPVVHMPRILEYVLNRLSEGPVLTSVRLGWERLLGLKAASCMGFTTHSLQSASPLWGWTFS